jgi:ribose 5-phosphate isomerase B
MMTANKVKGVRAGLAYNDDVARLIRQHNNANMIAFGANFMKLEDVLRRIDIFLSTDFEGGRHERRVNEIE